MVLLAFIGGLMVGGTVGVLVTALCLAAWRSDSAAEAAAGRMRASDRQGTEVPVDVPAAAGFADRGGRREAAVDRSA